MDRADAIAYLQQMALALELIGESPHRTAAFRRAARALSEIEDGDWDAWVEERGPALPGIGPGIRKRLADYRRTGTLADLEALHLQIPPGLFDLLRIRGLGPRRVRQLWQEADIVTLRRLERACRRGRLAKLPGFGEKTQQQLMEEIRRLRRYQGRSLRIHAIEQAQAREADLRAVKGLHDLTRAGELRRALETVGELVWVAGGDDPAIQLGRIATLTAASLPSPEEPDVVRFAAPDAPPERIVVTARDHHAARLFLETGNEAHVRGVLRRLAGRDLPSGDWLPATEEAIYAQAGLAYIPPEIREGRGEISASRSGELPDLLRAEQIQGVLHVHTTWSDGKGSVRRMTEEARRLGWSYIGIADHSQAAFYARGLSPERLQKQADEIAEVQEAFPDVRIFRGIESDILPDGTIDMPEASLAQLDFVIVSVHSVMRMTSGAMTDRLIRAIRHPQATVLGHPSGRLLLERESYPIDWERLLDAAADAGVAIEFNAPPERLELDWRLIRAATGRGIPICINPDAHRPDAMHHVIAGIDTARKGWLTAAQTLNTRGAGELAAFFREVRGRKVTR